MKVELYYFVGCPSWRLTLEYLKQALKAEGLSGGVDLVTVGSEADAQVIQFLGSPTIRINGADLEGLAAAARGYSFGCQVYVESDVSQGWPSADRIRQAIRQMRES